MQFYILGASVFFFATALALCWYSGCLLNRSIHILRYAMWMIERIESETRINVFKREGTE